MKQLLIYQLPELEVAALVEKGELLDLAYDSCRNPSLVGAIKKGRILKRRPHTQSYTVDVGLSLPALLEAPAGKNFSEGESVWVEIIRDGFREKGPKAMLTATHQEIPPHSVIGEFLKYHFKDTNVFIQRGNHSAQYRKLAPKAELIASENEMRELFDIEEVLSHLMESRIESEEEGWSMIIEPLETLTFIDINAGFRNHSNLDINLAAARRLGQEIMWRNLAGLIAVDFLNLRTPSQQKKVERELISHLESDRLKPRVLGFTKGGLCEVTRSRRYRALRDLMADTA